MIHILFTEDGIPSWIGNEPISGSEPVDLSDITDDSISFLAGHYRKDGKWIKRKEVNPPKPTAEELAEMERQELAFQMEERDRLVRETLALEADPLFFKWQAGEITRDEWISKRREIKNRFPKV